MLLNARTLTVRLYLAEIHRAPNGSVTALGLAWIPADIEAVCLAKALEHCTGFIPQAAPTRPLTELVTDTGRVKALVRRWGLKPAAQGVEKTLLTKARSIRAQVHWEKWSNGETFHLRRLR